MKLLANLRRGRVQRVLAALTAVSAPPLAFEIYLEHYKGSFGDKWEWVPVWLTPAVVAAGVGGVVSERAARTVLPGVSAVYAACGVLGIVLHARGVSRRPGGFEDEAFYNLVMGPPLLAPGACTLVGGLGLAAPLMPRER